MQDINVMKQIAESMEENLQGHEEAVLSCYLLDDMSMDEMIRAVIYMGMDVLFFCGVDFPSMREGYQRLKEAGSVCFWWTSLVGRADPVLPAGFTTEGATSNWYGTVHSGEVCCEYCGTKYGDYSLFKINNLYVPATEPCFDENGIVESCERPYEESAVPTLPKGYTTDADYVYDAEGNAIASYSAWVLDCTGLITGYVNGDVSLGELERCAENVFDYIIRIDGYTHAE